MARQALHCHYTSFADTLTFNHKLAGPAYFAGPALFWVHVQKPLSILFCVIVCASVSSAQMPPISSPTEYRQQPFDVIDYDLSLTIRDLENRQVEGWCAMRIEWTQPIAEPAFPFHLRYLRVDSVLLQGIRLTVHEHGIPDLDTFHYRAVLPSAVEAGDTTILTVFYQGTMNSEEGDQPWGGVHYQDSVLYALGVGFRNPAVSATSHWMPCYDHPSDKARFRCTMRVEGNSNAWVWAGRNAVASVGVLRTVDTTENIASFQWEETHPTATYLYTFAAGPLVKLVLPTSNTTPIEVYSLARDTAASSVAYRLVPRMTNVFSDLYGDYPFHKVGYVNTTRGAMEHQTLISFPISIVNRRDTINTTAAHELAHQWFGDLVSPLDFRHAWLTESFATYSEAAWVENVLGWNIYLASLLNGARAYQLRISQSEGVFPLFNFPRAAPSSNYPETIYRKGANVLAMARTLAGTEAFYSALRQYLTNHQYGTATTSDMQAALRAALGFRTDAFFNEWVYGIGWPKLRVTFTHSGSTWQATITQVQNEEHQDWPIFTTLPLNITYTHPTTGKPVDTVIVMEGAQLSLDIADSRGFSIDGGTKSRSLAQVLSTTSVQHHRDQTISVNLRPHPVTDSFSIDRMPFDRLASVQIVDLDGRTVQQFSMDADVASKTVDVSSIPSGAYMLHLQQEGSNPIPMPLHIVR